MDPTDSTLDSESAAWTADAGEIGDGIHPGAEREVPIQVGARVGRYVILERLGAGGMGVVWSAYDPELDRKVAIKLLLPGAGGRGSLGRARLLREAQALARLNHPNVVAVHDVGAHHDRVYVAMEMVEGTTFENWVKAQSRSWREILAQLEAAGRGLQAAHAAGLIHRDFKPGNVMVGDDGRIRVMDFGLARATAGTESGDEDDDHRADSTVEETGPRTPDVDGSGSAFSQALTRAGAVMGTPAYMAPEQHTGLQTDARTDQFSFCVTAWEALYGERPFAGKSLTALTLAVTEGDRRAPPAGALVPGWVQRVLQRGLDPDPDRRFPSMGELLQALDRGRTRRRWRWAAVGVLSVGTLLAGGAGVQQLRHRQAVAACEAEGQRAADEIWNPAARERVSTGLAEAGAPETFARVEPWLDQQAAALREARQHVCLEGRVNEQWSATRVEGARWCLEGRAMALSGLVEVLESADRAVAQRAVRAASSLPPIDPCVAEASQHRLPIPPDDPHARQQLAEAIRDLQGSKVAATAGRYDDALERARRAVDESVDRDPRIHAEAQVAEGSALARLGQRDRAREVTEDGFHRALEAGADAVAADATRSLVGIVGISGGQYELGREWGRIGLSLWRRLDRADDLPAASLRSNLALLERDAGDTARARELLEAVLVTRERVLGRDHPAVARALSNLALVVRDAGDRDRALELFERALRIKKQTLGPKHPEVATTLTALSSTHGLLGNLDEAMARGQEALELRRQALGPDHVSVADTLESLGILHARADEHGQARQMLERALEIRRAALGPDHPRVASTLMNLGVVARATGDHEQAVEYYEQALAIQEARLGPEHPNVARTSMNLGNAQADLGRREEAIQNLRRAAAIRESVLEPGHPDIVVALDNLAGLLRAGGPDHTAELAQVEARLAAAKQLAED